MANILVINCATNSTLQELKTSKSSGVYTYKESANFETITCNRCIVWRTCDDILHLSEHSLNKNLVDSELKIQFKNTLILQNGVSIHETEDKIYILVTTLVSVHRLLFDHPNKLFANPAVVSTVSGVTTNIATSEAVGSNTTTELLVYSIFHNVSTTHLNSPCNYCQLPTTSTSVSLLVPPLAIPSQTSCSWVNTDLEALFVVSKSSGSLNVIRLPSVNDINGEVKVQNLEMKQSSLLGMTMNLFTGIVPSIMKSTNNSECAAISLLAHSNAQHNLIFALCNDSYLRVISLRTQECLIEHNLSQNQQQLHLSQLMNHHAKISVNEKETHPLLQRRALSFKSWWYDDNIDSPLPCLVVHLAGPKYKSFYFFETVISQSTRNSPNSSVNGKSNIAVDKAPTVPHLRFLLEVFAPADQDVLDYFVSDNQLWALLQHNDTISLQYYSVESANFLTQQVKSAVSPPVEWIPVIADTNAPPEMGLRSSNTRDYYLNEIFWRGHFSLATIAKAINVSNRVSIESIEYLLSHIKIDQLVHEAIKYVDGVIRTHLDENQLECEQTGDEYIRHEMDAWHRLYQFCLDYHSEENKPLSIFVDRHTGVKGIVRQGRLDFIPALSTFDHLIDSYFLHCKELHQEKLISNGSLNGIDESCHLYPSLRPSVEVALKYRLSALMAPVSASISSSANGVFSATLEKSILELLKCMAQINDSLEETDLLDFDALIYRINSLSRKNKLTLKDIVTNIIEDDELNSFSEATVNSIDGFFKNCPMVAEAINLLLQHLSFEFSSDPNEISEHSASDRIFAPEGDEYLDMKMQEALQSSITPAFLHLLSSRLGLKFMVSSIGRIVNMRYKFCRDLFLFQFTLMKFQLLEYMPKIGNIKVVTIPQTAQLLFALDYLRWAAETPMVCCNLWWNLPEEHQNGSHRVDDSLTTIMESTNLLPKNGTLGKTGAGSSGHSTSALENSELLSVLEMHEYININRIGIFSHESIFYDAYPHSNILHFFIQFSGGISAKRLLSYKLGDDMSCPYEGGIWFSIVSSYLSSICQLLWPFSAGQFKLAEFLLGVGQCNLLESYIHRLDSWCLNNSSSRHFLKGICNLVTGEGHKAIRHCKQVMLRIDSEPFLHRIFYCKPAKALSSNIINSDDSIIPNARTLFRYHNKLIQLFKRYSSPDLVIEIVELALEMLNRDNDVEYKEHHASLHSTLFACHLQLGNVSQAFKAMNSNTDREQQGICLRQFILNLCETGQLSELVSFSYQNLEDDFIRILESKARASSANFYRQVTYLDNMSTISRLSASTAGTEFGNSCGGIINYYHILYSYFIRTVNFRRAAQAMYDYYRRLSQETNTLASGNNSVDLLYKQANALLVARNCLEMLEKPQSKWIIKSALKRTTAVCENGGDSKHKLKRKHGYFNMNSDYEHQEKTIIDIVDEEELLCEYELVNARIKLLLRNPKEYAIASTLLSADETVTLCVSAALYEQAFRIASLYSLPLEPIFEGMSSMYVQLLQGSFNRARLDDELSLYGTGPFGSFEPYSSQYSADMLTTSPNGGCQAMIDLLEDIFEDRSNTVQGAFLNNSSLAISDRMWHLVMHYLARYETAPQKSSRLMKTVAEKLLSNGIMIPASLVKVYQKVHCTELIRLLMTYNFLAEATQVSLDYMNAFMGEGTEYFDIKHHLYPNCPPLCVPLHIFDCLLKILSEEMEESKLEQWNQLKEQESPHGYDNQSTIKSVDDYAVDDKIDYQTLHQNLSQRRKQLWNSIVSCS